MKENAREVRAKPVGWVWGLQAKRARRVERLQTHLEKSGLIILHRYYCLVTWHSKLNPIELNFSQTQSNSIKLSSWIEFD